MKYFINILLIFFSSQILCQNFTFKIRKVPKLKYFVFADFFDEHNLKKKTQNQIGFPKRMYLQIYDNDTFLIRWSESKLQDANNQFDYLDRDSLTFVNKLKRQEETGIKLTFPFKKETYQMFVVSEESLVKKKEYKTGPPTNQIERIQYYFDYNKKNIVLIDVKAKDVSKYPQIDAALNLSARIKLGFFNNKLYSNEKTSKEIPLNIVKTYPVNFILANGKTCQKDVFWNGIIKTKTLNNDTSSLRKDKEFIDKLPSDAIISMNENRIEFWESRRYIYIKNDSQLVVTKLNRNCMIFQKHLFEIDTIPKAEYWYARDGVKNYLIKIEDGYWGWVYKYGCIVEWKVFKDKKIKRLLKKSSKSLFENLTKIPSLNKSTLNESCKRL